MTSVTTETEQANAAKAEFDQIYGQPDPRQYFRTLGSTDYQIPDRAKSTFTRVFSNLQRIRNRSELSVVDVGCSYGINAALLRFDLSLDDLYRRYAEEEIRGLSSDAVEQRDRQFYSTLPRALPHRMTGLDVASDAVRYAESVSLLDRGFAFDLEADSFDPARLTPLADTDVVISTGCVGYVTDTTFTRLLDAASGPAKPWVASFVLRMFPYDAIAACCADRGLVTYKLTGRTFVQRRFVDQEERAGVLAQLEDRDISAGGLEATGCFHAEFFLSIPKPDADKLDLDPPWTVIDAP